jgi:hypothetical protein
MNGKEEETVRDLNAGGTQYSYRVPGWTEERRTFSVGGRTPFSLFSFAVRYSNLAESCNGAGEISKELYVRTRRMTVPKSASAPIVKYRSGGMVTLQAQIPLDMGGFMYDATGTGI